MKIKIIDPVSLTSCLMLCVWAKKIRPSNSISITKTNYWNLFIQTTHHSSPLFTMKFNTVNSEESQMTEGY